MQDMAVTMSDEEFEQIYGYFYRAYSAIDNTEVAALLKEKDSVWKVLRQVAEIHGRDLPDPNEELKAKLQAQLDADQRVSRRRLPPKR